MNTLNSDLAGTDDAPVIEAALKGKKAPKANEKVTIVVSEPADGGVQQFFGCNGNTFLIKFGVPVTVPRYMLNVLDELIQTKTIPLAEGGFTERDFKRFPYSIVG